MRFFIGFIALGIGCASKAGGGSQDDTEADLDAPPAELVMPDLEGIDLDQAFVDALNLSLSVNTQVAWAGHADSLARRHEGCPDLYVGAPLPLVDDDLLDEDARGTSWYDNCATPGGLFYRGLLYWDAEVGGSGNAETSAGRTSTGRRSLVGNGVVGDDDETRFQLRGEASDSINRVDAPGYSRWTYSSTVTATVTGTDAFDAIASATPGGWRADMYTFATGGDADALELRGDVYLFESRIQGRFDSVSVDITLPGPLGAAPDACTLEPRGWIGIRDENAYWIDVVFLPFEGQDATGPSYEDPAYSACDGCGKAYVRGIEAPPIGEICPDFTQLWADGIVPVPEVADFILDVRGSL